MPASQVNLIGASKMREIDNAILWTKNLKVSGPGVEVSNSPTGARVTIKGNSESTPQQQIPINPCRVQRNGGTDGDATHDCTATYDIYALDNTTKINTTGGPYLPKNVASIRSPKTPMTYATYGHWFYDADGTTRILVVYDESPTAFNACS